MNVDTLAGSGSQVKGQLKEGLGDATNDPTLQQDGIADQVSGTVRKGIGQVRDIAMKQPLATAATVGVIGLAIFNSLRGKKSY
jgi:uncharacterized protein YjbJ (UPF0337 family)